MPSDPTDCPIPAIRYSPRAIMAARPLIVGLTVATQTFHLQLDVLAFTYRRGEWQSIQIARDELAVEVRHTDFQQMHTAFARQKARKGNFELRIGQKTDAFAGQLVA